MDVDAEREKISKEIKELERILDPGSSGINDDVSESSLDSDSEAGQRPPSLVRAALLPFLPWTVCFHPSFVRGDLPGAGPLPRAVLRAGLPGLGHQPSPCSSSHRAQTQGPLPGPRLPRLSFSPPHTLPQAPSAPPRSSDWRPACRGGHVEPPSVLAAFWHRLSPSTATLGPFSPVTGACVIRAVPLASSRSQDGAVSCKASPRCPCGPCSLHSWGTLC